MISGLFFYKSFVKILIFRFTRSISRFRITRNFTENFPRNFPKIFRKFLGKFLTPHLPPLPTPHIIHPHPTPKTLNPLRTLNPLFSKTHFLLDYASFSHHFHIYIIYIMNCKLANSIVFYIHKIGNKLLYILMYIEYILLLT